MRAVCRIDQLCSDAYATGGLAHRAFKHIAHAKLPPDLLHVDRLALVRKARIRAMTKSQRMRESAVMISSAMPSAKYSCSGSPLILANGSTAIDGLSGRARA